MLCRIQMWSICAKFHLSNFETVGGDRCEICADGWMDINPIPLNVQVM